MVDGPQQPPAAAGDGAAGGLLQSLQALLGELPGLVSDRVRLASLELRRAGAALAQVVALAVAAALLLITAWLAIWVGLASAAIGAGIPWGWVLLLILAINLGAAWLAVQRARALLALLGLPATVRRLTIAPSPEHDEHHYRSAQQQPLAS